MAGTAPIPKMGSKKPNKARLGMVWMVLVIPRKNVENFVYLVMRTPTQTPTIEARIMEIPVNQRCSFI